MNSGFIAALLVMVVMTAFTFIILHIIAVNTGDKIRDNVIDQIKSYDVLIQKKEAELRALTVQVENERNKLEAEQQKGPFTSQPLTGVFVTADAVYRNDDFSQDYRNLKEQFRFDRYEIVKSIYEQYEGKKDEKNKLLDGLMDKFSFENTFKIAVFQSDEQLEIIKAFITEEEKLILDDYFEENTEFNCLSFYQWLNMQRRLHDRVLLVKAAEEEENYDEIGESVQTKYDTNLCEGIQIYVGNKLYDYGIRKYELIS